MSGSIIIGIIILAILATSILCTPHLLFGLGAKDGWRSLCDSKYLLFLFAHRRFSKVKAGKQTYERYCNDIRSPKIENGLSEKERKAEGSFRQLILDKDKEEGIISYLCSKLKTMSKGMEYAALVIALKQFDGVHRYPNRIAAFSFLESLLLT